MSRLTDEELGEIERTRFQTHMGNPPASVLVRRMLSEIKERRAADLKPDEVGDLRTLADDIRAMHRRSADIMYAPHVNALSILDRLTKGAPLRAEEGWEPGISSHREESP
jgi:hypothetical protein